MSTPEIEQKNKRLLRKLGIAIFLMFCFAFALVPLYNVMCKTLGLNGKPVLDAKTAKAVAEGLTEDLERTVIVEFVTTMNESMPWEFHPLHKKVEMHPGGSIHTAYYAKNLTDHEMVMQAIPSITPGRAAQHVKKLECFCFTHQTLGPHESAELPLVFILDDDIPEDVNTMTLSYTLFDLTPKSI